LLVRMPDEGEKGKGVSRVFIASDNDGETEVEGKERRWGWRERVERVKSRRLQPCDLNASKLTSGRKEGGEEEQGRRGKGERERGEEESVSATGVTGRKGERKGRRTSLTKRTRKGVRPREVG
jgi:hypothetical protein